MKIKAYGKFNLTLKVGLKSKKNGLHKIKSIIFPYNDEYDVVELKPIDNLKTIFTCNNLKINEKNSTVFQAYQKFIDFFPKFKTKSLHLNLIKNVVIGSGLGYSASDAVATIKLLCSFFNVDYNSTKIKSLIKTLGSDALFFYLAKPALIYGYGNKIKYLNIKQIRKYEISNLKIINSNIESIAKDVYGEFDNNFNNYQKFSKVANKYFNMLEKPAFKINLELSKYYNYLVNKYNNVLLSGSGGAFLVW